MMELYQAYADYRVMMEITEEIVSACLETLGLSPKVQFGDVELDFTRPWRRAKYADLLKEHSGCDIDDIAAVRAKARALASRTPGWTIRSWSTRSSRPRWKTSSSPRPS